MARRFILALLAAALLTPLSMAQMRAQMRGSFRGSARSTKGFRSSFIGRHRSAIASGYFLAGTPFFYDDYAFEPMQSEPASPQVILVQAPAADTTPPAKSAPLLIELQGNRYVRYGGIVQSTQQDVGARGVSALEAISRQTVTPPRLAPPDLPPTVLVYRDGHHEEVADYAIVGRVIYAHNNEEGGYGMKDIQLSALDIPATIKANRENGVNFVLPAGPNEVVTRP
jgi:hypothetical protein